MHFYSISNRVEIKPNSTQLLCGFVWLNVGSSHSDKIMKIFSFHIECLSYRKLHSPSFL